MSTIIPRRLLLLIFVVTFALGAMGAVILLHRLSQPSKVQARAASTHADKADADKTDADKSDAEDDDAKESVRPWPEDAGTPEQVMYSQPDLMKQAIDRVTPRTVGKSNLFVIGFAGDGEEDVFRNEVEFVERQFIQRFDAAGHTLMLINNPATVSQRPLASLSNLQTAIDAMDAEMDPDQDILLLFLTSHGSREHELYVGLDPLPLDQIAPEDLADVFSDAHIRYKVIVISACYAGGFIDALKNDTTMIITAARADRTSFGCGTDSDITDFGRALFVEGLNHNDSFQDAYAEAAKLVDSWETRDNEEHSHPQIVTSPKIEAQLKKWRSGIQLGPPLLFKPASAPKTKDDDSRTAAASPLN